MNVSSLDPRPSRRALAPLAAVALVLVTVLSGCASAVQQVRSGSADSGGAGGGTLHLGVMTDLQPATPFSNASDATNVLIGNVYDTLLTVPANSTTPRPSLATSWKLAADGRSLTLQLRQGVRFHSGRALTPADVEFSIKTWADPSWAVQFQRTAAAVTGFDTSDPHAITLRFAHPLSNVDDLLSEVPIIDRDTIAGLKAGRQYVGTGPYEFKSWTPGSSLELVRNPHYWGGKPAIGAVDVRIVSDPQSLVSQLRSGQLDTIIGGSSRDLQALGQDQQFHVQPMTGAEQQVYVGANLTDRALSDPRLRQAIAYAVDRPRITSEVYRGVGYPINVPWPKSSPAYDAALNHHFDRDTAKAKALVAQVVQSNGGKAVTVPLEYDSSNGNLEATAQIVQTNLQEVGIAVQLQPEDHNQFIKELIGAQFKGLWLAIHSYAQFTPSTLAVSAYPFNAEHNASHFSSPRYTQDSEAAWELPDGRGAQAKAAYARLSQDFLDNAFLIELSVIYYQFASTTQLHGVTWSKRQELHFAGATLGQG